MGLFSRKTIVSVSSVVYPMGEEPSKVPDLVKSSVITAGLQHTNVNQAIMSSIYDGMGVKLSQAYAYASHSYYAGMPKGFPVAQGTGGTTVLEILSKEHLELLYVGDTIVLQSASVIYSNDYDLVVQGIVTTNYHYDFYDLEVKVATGAIDVGASLIINGPYRDPAHPGEIGYLYEFTNPDTSVEDVEVWYAEALFAGAEEIKPRVVMEYTRNGAISKQHVYAFGGSDNRLNIYLRQLQNPQSGTFPAIVLKKSNIYLNDNAFSGGAWETSPAYRTSKAYANRLDLKIDDLIALVKGNAQEEDIDFAFIQPGLMLSSPSKSVVKYLYNYFNTLRLSMPDNKPAYDAWIAANEYPAAGVVKKKAAENCPAQSLRLADPETPESSLDIEIAWRYITYEEKSGTIDKYESACGAQEEVMARFGRGRGLTNAEVYDITKVYFRKALSPSTYAEICVCGLWHENYVYKGHSVQSGPWEAFNDPDDDYGTGFIIPLDYHILMSLSPRERLQLSQESLHMVFNCYVARKQKWYETSLFKFVLAVISIVIVVLSWGTTSAFVSGLYASFYSATLVAAVGVTVAAAVAAVLTAAFLVTMYAGISFVAKEAGKWAAEHWGPVWGAITQIVATVALSWGLGKIGPMPSIPPATLAQQVLKVGTFIVSAMSTYTEYAYIQLEGDIKTWEDYAKNDGNPLDNVNKLLEEMFPDLNLAQKAIMYQPENMEQFLGRTLTLTDGLTGRLFAPIHDFTELTLTPRLP